MCGLEGHNDCPGCVATICDSDSENDCFIRQCARKRGIDGCYVCSDYPCCKWNDWPLNQDKQNRAFIRFIREFGKQALIERLHINSENGITYIPGCVPSKSTGDYDVLETEDKVYQLLRYGRNNS